MLVAGNIHTHPKEVIGNSGEGEGEGEGEFQKPDFFEGQYEAILEFPDGLGEGVGKGVGVQSNKPPMGGIWTFSGIM